ncbi:hypothetical protein EVAR_95862_1 [Eumeta japonica]|uniref:Uncharacterized protein n=1 Tax=Eumeta variegata TaxID=151549 RepID=A0A4C1VLK8_EUMVA|nr:hypothetical protein EVAR_95862_1 [Eumeta japonica]
MVASVFKVLAFVSPPKADCTTSVWPEDCAIVAAFSDTEHYLLQYIARGYFCIENNLSALTITADYSFVPKSDSAGEVKILDSAHSRTIRGRSGAQAAECPGKADDRMEF